MTKWLANEYLICALDEHYAIHADSVVEIIEYAQPTPVPETPPYIIGILNLHEQVVPIVDLRLRFHKTQAALVKRRCIVIVKFEEVELGLAVDKVLDLCTILPEQTAPPPQVGNDYAHVFIKQIGAVDGKMYLIIDENKMVNHSDLTFLTKDE